ncbi:MAG: hypothetical protein AABX01_00890 [Candidatus Micrarchaeota archaeon]
MDIFSPQILLGLFLSIIHFIGEELSPKLERYHSELVSFAAGVMVTLLFMELVPLVAKDTFNFSFVLLGFVIFHSIGKYVHQRHPKQLRRELSVLDVWGFFLVNFLNGIAIVLIYEADQSLAFLLAVPLGIVELASSAFLAHLLEERRHWRHLMKITLSASVLLGALLGSVLPLSHRDASFFFSFSIGTLFYIVVRDMLPKHQAGKLEAFLLGVLLMYVSITAFG